MNNVECESCVKRKTMYCPNSFKCYATKDKPYWQNRIMLLEENNQLKEQRQELRNWLEDEITDIVPKGCGINYNCEYDSEENYISAMEERSRVITLKEVLSKLNELEGKNE